MKRIFIPLFFLFFSFSVVAQLNTNRLIDNGRAALYYKDYFLSIQYFNQVIKVKPHLAEPYMYRGFAKLYLDEYLGAEQDCSHALNLNPFLPDAYIARAYARMGLSKYQDAVADFNKALEFAPDKMTLLAGRGSAYAETKDYEAALEDYSQAINKDPKNRYAYYERGRLHFNMNDTIGAIDDFSTLIELDKFSAIGWSARGVMYLQSKKYKEAIADFDEAIILEGRSGDYVNRALAKYQLKDLRGAMADYDKALEINPNEYIGYLNRGLLRAQVGDRTRAIEDFSMALVFNPEEYAAILNRAILRLEVGDMQEAIADFNIILNRYPNFSPAYFGRAQAKAKLGRQKEAELDYNTGYYVEKQQLENLKKQPDVADSNIREENDDDISNYKKIVIVDTEKEQKKLQYKDNEYRGNIQNVNVEIKPENNFILSYYSIEKKINTPMIHYYKGVQEYNKKQKSDNQLRITNKEIQLANDLIVMHLSLINEWSKRIEANPNDVDAYFNRAINYGLIQDFDNAIESYTKAINAKSDFALAYFCRANVRYKMLSYEFSSRDVAFDPKKNKTKATNQLPEQQFTTDYELIIRDYDKAIELAPDFIYAYFNRANMAFAANNYASAIDDYTRAIGRESDFAEAYFNRGLAYILSGNKEKGLSDLSKAGELGISVAYNIIKRYS